MRTAAAPATGTPGASWEDLVAIPAAAWWPESPALSWAPSVSLRVGSAASTSSATGSSTPTTGWKASSVPAVERKTRGQEFVLCNFDQLACVPKINVDCAEQNYRLGFTSRHAKICCGERLSPYVQSTFGLVTKSDVDCTFAHELPCLYQDSTERDAEKSFMAS